MTALAILTLQVLAGHSVFSQSSKSSSQNSSASSAGSLWVTGYYQDYAICTMPPAQVDYSAFTHLIYFHTDVDVNVAPYFLPVVSAAESVRIEWSNSFQGCARTSGESYQAELIRRSHTAGVKVLLCLGGIWGSGADRMALLAADSAKTQIWSDAIIAYLVRKGFDGIDLDWEFPRSQIDYMRMLRILRRGLDSMPARGIFTAAVYGDANSSAYDYPNLSLYLDQVNVMTYDMWNNQNTVWLNSPLSKPAGSPNNWRTWRTSSALDWAARGVPKSILANGIPFYSWRFSNVTALGQPLAGYNYALYSDAVNALNAGGTYHWNDSAKAPYVTYTNNGVNYLITYDDTNSVKYKVQRTKEDGIGGIMIYGIWDGWINNAPAGKKDPLLQAVKAAVGGTIVAPPTPLSPSEGALTVPTSTLLTWTSVGGASSYGIQVSEDASFNSLVVDQSGITSTSFSATALSPATAHFWRLNSRTSAGNSTWSPTRSFETIGPSRISGQSFFDVNQNRIKDASEASMAGWVVHLLGPVSATAVTDPTGWYSFNDIPSGQYSVTVDIKSLWAQTTPSASPMHNVTISDGSVFDAASFGLYSSSAFSFDVERYWNIVAVPVQNPDGRTTTLFSLAATDAYSFADGYFVEDSLVDGPAYWMKFNASHDVWTAGTPFTTASVNVIKGWNFVGSVSTPVLTSSIVSIPPGIMVGSIFGYSKGNFLADTIYPGHGYWVQVAEEGTIVVSSLNPGSSSAKETAAQVVEGLNAVTFSTPAGESQTLYFGMDRTSRASRRYDMPPVPPAGAFDARFTSEGSDGGAFARVLREASAEPVELPLELRSATYPLTISWDVKQNEESYSLRIGGGQTATLLGQGSMTIAAPAGGDPSPATMSVIVAERAATVLPTSFSLLQNYPNPFNNATLIGFSIPSPSSVRLEIFNILGERVAVPLERELAQGSYSIPFDASGLPTGVYFYKLSAYSSAGESFTKTSRMLLSK